MNLRETDDLAFCGLFSIEFEIVLKPHFGAKFAKDSRLFQIFLHFVRAVYPRKALESHKTLFLF
ncbi:MAG: hypothetical protein EAZ57_11390 [Cytophagales bacterium]|nr:MAG: hypothetical protein EAZ67_12325 [Cytophagales bacterium]TAF59364.1 MAG: hypothetical protein EAZ57_11390 [Cytophagales bacterium]